ncbi:YegP family protein [Flavihumibacter fluvii]|uniref:YegP family protein n=1 Tax=Flavihumibacter fluvii TaxID=2838157 RepID=UPI00336A7A32
MTSESYSSKANCENGIDSIMNTEKIVSDVLMELITSPVSVNSLLQIAAFLFIKFKSSITVHASVFFSPAADRQLIYFTR